MTQENDQNDRKKGAPPGTTDTNANLDQPARGSKATMGFTVPVELYDEFNEKANAHFRNKGGSKSKYFELLWHKYKERKYGGANS